MRYCCIKQEQADKIDYSPLRQLSSQIQSNPTQKNSSREANNGLGPYFLYRTLAYWYILQVSFILAISH